MEAVAPYQTERLRAARAAEGGAEAILRVMDDLITSIVITFTGSECPLRVGPDVSGEKLDVLLDAIGNYLRHRQEWRMAYTDGKTFERRQLKSMEPIARVISGDRDVSGNAAFAIIAEEQFPMLRILDALSDYSSLTGSGSFTILKENVLASAKEIIDQEWPSGGTSACQCWSPRKMLP